MYAIKHDIAYNIAVIEAEHKLPARASYGLSVVRIWEKIDRIVMPVYRHNLIHFCNSYYIQLHFMRTRVQESTSVGSLEL